MPSLRRSYRLAVFAWLVLGLATPSVEASPRRRARQPPTAHEPPAPPDGPRAPLAPVAPLPPRPPAFAPVPAMPWTGHVHVERLRRGDAADAAPERGRLGLAVMPLTEPLRKFFGAAGSEGMLVAEVASDSPASRAKISVGDVLVRVDGDAIVSGDQVGVALRDRGEGDKVDVVVVRKKKRRTLRVTLDDAAPRDDHGGWPGAAEPAELDGLRRRIDELESRLDRVQRERGRR